MKDQQSFTDIEYGNRKKKTKREEFLDIMQEIIPWDKWVEEIKPYYPSGRRGRPPIGIEKMLRMYLLQMWFNLSDKMIVDAINDSYSMRKFMGLNFMNEQVPDSTTLLNFRHLLEKHGIRDLIFESLTRFMRERGRVLQSGSIIDACIVSVPGPSKGTKKSRSKTWYKGEKCDFAPDESSDGK